MKEAVAYGGYSWCNSILELAMDALTLYYGGHLVMIGELTGGTLVSFILYQLSLGEAIENIGDVYTGLVDAVGAAEKVGFLLRSSCWGLSKSSHTSLHIFTSSFLNARVLNFL